MYSGTCPLRVICFDCFGTVFDMSQVVREDLIAYGEHIRKPFWSPLKLPAYWDCLQPWPDCVEGLARLRTKFMVVALSNAPMGMMARLSKNAGITWDAIIPLEMAQVYKPDLRAYAHAARVLDVPIHQMLMVSANKDFGDIENSVQAGMYSCLIRNQGATPNLLYLAEQYGC